MSTLYRYIRHSDTSADQPNSREAQLRTIQTWLDQERSQNSAMSLLRDGGEFYDADVSGGKAFARRAAGSVLAGRLVAGDVIVVAKWDRLTRNVRDGINLLHWCEERGVSIVALDLRVDTRTAAGYMMACQMMLFANYELSRGKERTKEGLDIIKYNKGVAIAHRCPTGWKYVRKHEQCRKDGQPYATIVPYSEERNQCEYIMHLKDTRGMNYSQIARFLSRNGMKRTNNGKTNWDYLAVKVRYLAAKANFPCGPDVDNVTGRNSEQLMVAVEVKD